jgi:cyclopropane-fatty-acyl-phospholipid synthase
MTTAREVTRPRLSVRNLLQAGFADKLCRDLLIKKLSGIKNSFVEIIDPEEGSFALGDRNAPACYQAQIKIHRLRAYSRMALGGSIGAAESYMEADWDCDSLVSLVRIFVLNRDILNALDAGAGALLSPFAKISHRLKKNSLSGSKDNIRAHYDLGNDFFSLFLDPTLMYSSGVFLKEDSTMFEASTEKNDRICRKLNLKPSDHVLEIGTGWGGFALHAAQNYGCRITTTTISQKQYELAEKRIRDAHLQDRITLLLKDYRLLEGTFDKVVSIEMIEAVGLDHLETYFEVCSQRLKPHGQMLLQAITIRDQYYDQARKNVDFIQRHIFPGSGIPSVHAMSDAIKKKTDFKVDHLEDIGIHYAKTLRSWSDSLKEKKAEVLSLGYSDELYRMWQFYFAYCEGGFREKSIGCAQISLTKPLFKEEF